MNVPKMQDMESTSIAKQSRIFLDYQQQVEIDLNVEALIWKFRSTCVFVHRL